MQWFKVYFERVYSKEPSMTNKDLDANLTDISKNVNKCNINWTSAWLLISLVYLVQRVIEREIACSDVI